MLEKEIADWRITFAEKQGELSISVTRVDGSPVIDTDADVGGADELGYRLTSQRIEEDYRRSGFAEAETQEDSVSIANWKIDLVNDEDHHLGIYCVHSTSDSLEHVSLTNGTPHSPSCDIVVTSAAYMNT